MNSLNYPFSIPPNQTSTSQSVCNEARVCPLRCARHVSFTVASFSHSLFRAPKSVKFATHSLLKIITKQMVYERMFCICGGEICLEITETEVRKNDEEWNGSKFFPPLHPSAPPSLAPGVCLWSSTSRFTDAKWVVKMNNFPSDTLAKRSQSVQWAGSWDLVSWFDAGWGGHSWTNFPPT